MKNYQPTYLAISPGNALPNHGTGGNSSALFDDLDKIPLEVQRWIDSGLTVFIVDNPGHISPNVYPNYRPGFYTALSIYKTKHYEYLVMGNLRAHIVRKFNS